MAEAERRLYALGHRRVALGVHAGNRRAIRIYRYLSFRVWRSDLPTFRDEVLPDGSTVRRPDRCVVLLKDLAG